MEKTAILIDLGFFIKRTRRLWLTSAQSTTPQDQAFAIASLLQRHIKGHLTYKKESTQLYRTFIYDAPPLSKKMHHPKTGQAIDFSKSDAYILRTTLHQMIRQQPMTALRLGVLNESEAVWTLKDKQRYKRYLKGELAYDAIDTDEFIIDVKQKQVDMKIGMDITWLALKKLVQRIVLISGDSDFVPVAKLARQEGITFILDPMRQSIRPDLSEHIDLLRTPKIYEQESYDD